jgi:hypothetical protein
MDQLLDVRRNKQAEPRITRERHGRTGKRKALLGEKTDNYVPWMALQQQGNVTMACFIALDYLGTWTIAFERAADRGVLSASLPEWRAEDLRRRRRYAFRS